MYKCVCDFSFFVKIKSSLKITTRQRRLRWAIIFSSQYDFAPQRGFQTGSHIFYWLELHIIKFSDGLDQIPAQNLTRPDPSNFF